MTDATVQVVNQFDELVEEGHAARDALLKIFNKKIKYSKKKDAGTCFQLASHTLLTVLMQLVLPMHKARTPLLRG